MSDWQPIETAPEEGVFLVYMPDAVRGIQVMYRHKNVSIIGHAFAFNLEKPTHWAPIPEKLP